MENISLWKGLEKSVKHYPTLEENIDTDVVIIGGGITGITTALLLNEAGKKIVLLDAHQIGGVTTGFSTGNLYIATQPYYQNIISKFDIQTAKVVADSRKLAIDFIEKNVIDKKIECNFARRPWYLYTTDRSKVSFLEKEVDAFKQLDFDLNYTHDLPFFTKFKKAAVIENQARFNPLEYVKQIAAYLEGKGCRIFENSAVADIEENKNETCTIKTSFAKITAKTVVMATHTPIGLNSKHLFTAPYRSYAIAAYLKEDVYPECNLWSVEKPHYAISTQSTTSNQPGILIVAGADHKTGQSKNTRACYLKLEQFIKQNFNVSKIAYQWSAQHYRSADNVPYIGLANSAKQTYIATGFFADGLVYGTLAGIILSDLILKKNHALAQAYNPMRHTLNAAFPFLLKENFNVFLQYLKDLPKHSSKQFSEIETGEGKIMEIENEKWAVSRDLKNQLHIVSAICTHMKCVVGWNNAEKTWDCPCHGSRFSCDGRVIEGPALYPLSKKST